MRKTDLTKGNVLAVIVALALPIMGSSLLQFTYNLIDMMWVGRLGSNAVASIGSSSLYINIGNAVNALVVIGTGIKTAHAVGRKDEKAVNEYINAGIIINCIIGILFGIILITGGRSFIGFLHINDSEVEKNAYYYLAINAPVLFFAFFNMMYTRILGSFGNNNLAFKINSSGVIINIILDPLFIYVFKFGVIGAALSTLTSNIVMFILFNLKSDKMLSYKGEHGFDIVKMKEIIKLGFPMAFQRIIFTIINIMLAKIIAVFGSDAIAAQKIGVQIESVTYMVIGGFNSAVSSFTGQNFGAQKHARIKEGYRSALFVGIIYSLFTAGIFIVFNRNIIRMFITDEETILIAADYLKVVAFSQIFSAVEMISNGLFTGVGKPKIPAVISIVFTALRIPLAIFLTKSFGVNGVWMSISISSVMKGICAYTVYKVQWPKIYESV